MSNTQPTMTKVGPFQMLPPAPGLCPQCAVKHPPEEPHNAQSLHYQYFVYGTAGRWPTWEDAMSHCDETTKEAVRLALRSMGVDPTSTNLTGRSR